MLDTANANKADCDEGCTVKLDMQAGLWRGAAPAKHVMSLYALPSGLKQGQDKTPSRTPPRKLPTCRTSSENSLGCGEVKRTRSSGCTLATASSSCAKVTVPPLRGLYTLRKPCTAPPCSVDRGHEHASAETPRQPHWVTCVGHGHVPVWGGVRMAAQDSAAQTAWQGIAMWAHLCVGREGLRRRAALGLLAGQVTAVRVAVHVLTQQGDLLVASLHQALHLQAPQTLTKPCHPQARSGACRSRPPALAAAAALTEGGLRKMAAWLSVARQALHLQAQSGTEPPCHPRPGPGCVQPPARCFRCAHRTQRGWTHLAAGASPSQPGALAGHRAGIWHCIPSGTGCAEVGSLHPCRILLQAADCPLRTSARMDCRGLERSRPRV